MKSSLNFVSGNKMPIVISYKAGQNNVFLNGMDTNNFDNLIKPETAFRINRAVQKLNKNQNYWPKSVRVMVSILVQEE